MRSNLECDKQKIYIQFVFNYVLANLPWVEEIRCSTQNVFQIGLVDLCTYLSELVVGIQKAVYLQTEYGGGNNVDSVANQ